MRWSTIVGGTDRLPVRAGALIVVNARRYALAPVHAALAIGHETGRPVRFVGRPDIAPVGAVARRLGGLLARPDEVAGALRAGELARDAGRDRRVHPRRVGRVDHRLDRRRRGDEVGGLPGGDGQLAVGHGRRGSRSALPCGRAAGGAAR